MSHVNDSSRIYSYEIFPHQQTNPWSKPAGEWNQAKRLTNISKETNEYVKRDQQICQKRPTNVLNTTYICDMPFFWLQDESPRLVLRENKTKRITNTSHEIWKICQKRPTDVSKETYRCVKGDQHVRHGTFFTSRRTPSSRAAKESDKKTYRCIKRDIQINHKRPTSISNETYKCCRTRPIYVTWHAFYQQTKALV